MKIARLRLILLSVLASATVLFAAPLVDGSAAMASVDCTNGTNWDENNPPC
jgi:hypothetical protein